MLFVGLVNPRCQAVAIGFDGMRMDGGKAPDLIRGGFWFSEGRALLKIRARPAGRALQRRNM